MVGLNEIAEIIDEDVLEKRQSSGTPVHGIHESAVHKERGNGHDYSP